MKLLLLNDTYFGDSLNQPGVEILRVGPGPLNDFRINPETDDLEDVLDDARFVPDKILQVDSIDRRVFFRGLEALKAPRAFYAIDAPINEFWQRDWAHFFDYYWVDQPNSIKRLNSQGIDWVDWLPLAADPEIYHLPESGQERDLDIVFVGTIDPERRPKRSAILYRLKQIADVKVIDGEGKRSVHPQEVANYYRCAKIVLNELLFDGVNLRTLEAMACGAVVMTEENRGESELFADLPVLVTFNADNLEEVVTSLLENWEDNRVFGYEAASVVNSSHLLEHRATHILNKLEELKPRPARDDVEARVHGAWALWRAAQKWKELRSQANASGQVLAAHMGKLPLQQQVELFEVSGHVNEALNLLLERWKKGKLEEEMTPVMASLALAMKKNDLAGEVLGVQNAAESDLHVTIANRLMTSGNDLVPGFNQTAGPVSCWSAFEHYRRAFTLDEDNIAALEGMDSILQNHHSSEHVLSLWQRWHARNPRNPEAIKKFIHRAKTGYFRPRPVTEGRAASRPFVKTSPRTQDRMPFSGPSIGNSR